MFMQPIIDLRTGALSRVEALARLILADGTMVPPDSFVPRLSSSDLDELFRMGLHEVLQRLAQWDDAGLAVSVSVNLPPSTLVHPECSRWVADALRVHRLDPKRLALELLETGELDSPEQLAAIDELVSLGVGLSLDDLGSGYSSLKRLAQLPFDSIKIDRGLLAYVATKPVETLSLIATLAQMGRDFGTAVVVEGIEDAGLAEAASVLGATLGQGYFFARPMPADAILAWAQRFHLPARFHLPERAGHLQTDLGALAYHWQFTRWGSPHPFGQPECPISGFIADHAAPGSDPDRWHSRQHDLGSNHAGESRLLLDWLVGRA
jgi:EAL domain-containing protein (putative c-di-GMP-specific phosphodiesterase class I)